jgi:hypothetical protein
MAHVTSRLLPEHREVDKVRPVRRNQSAMTRQRWRRRSMGSQRLGACAPRKDAERRPRPSLPAGDQQQPAVNAEHRPRPARDGMLGLAACRDGYVRVHDAAALRAVTDRRVLAPMIHVLTRIGLAELCSHSGRSFCSFCRSEMGSRLSASQRFSMLKGRDPARPKASTRGTLASARRYPLPGYSRDHAAAVDS